MARYRKNPICPKCGVAIEGKYWKPASGIGFAGDTFEGWDWRGHVCRIGIKYFIERTDENKWWTGSDWTNDPIKAMLWNDESEAKKHLTESMLISPRIPCGITEHEFVSMQEGGEK